MSLQLFWCRYSNDPQLDRLLRHLPFETLFERQQGGVDSIFERDILIVTFLQEGFRVDHVLADRRGFPCPVGARGVDLVKGRAAVDIPTRY